LVFASLFIHHSCKIQIHSPKHRLHFEFYPFREAPQRVLKHTADAAHPPRQTIHSLDLQFGPPAPTCGFFFPGRFHPVIRGDKNKHVGDVDHRITESQNGRGWKGPLWVI